MTMNELLQQLQQRLGLLVKQQAERNIRLPEPSAERRYLLSLLERASTIVTVDAGVVLSIPTRATIQVQADGTAPIPRYMASIYRILNTDVTEVPRVDIRNIEQGTLPDTAEGYSGWAPHDYRLHFYPRRGGSVEAHGYRTTITYPPYEEGVTYHEDSSQLPAQPLLIEALLQRAIAEWLMDVGEGDLYRLSLQRYNDLIERLHKMQPTTQKIIYRLNI